MTRQRMMNNEFTYGLFCKHITKRERLTMRNSMRWYKQQPRIKRTRRADDRYYARRGY